MLFNDFLFPPLPLQRAHMLHPGYETKFREGEGTLNFFGKVPEPAPNTLPQI